MSDFLALYHPPGRVANPGAVEGAAIDLLRMQWQVFSHRLGKLFDRIEGHGRISVFGKQSLDSGQYALRAVWFARFR